LLLGGCTRRCSGRGCTALDYGDFLRFGGVTYYADDSNLVGRRPGPEDLGPVFGLVARNPPDDDLHYQIRDGDAGFVAPGAPVSTVKGYRPTFRLAASHDGRLWFYEAREVPGARRGADVFDLAGKVRYIGVNSRFDGTTELAAVTEPKQVAALVRAVLEAPFRPGQAPEGESCVLAFHLLDRTAVTRGYHLGTGRLDPGVFVPRAFSRAVTAALRAAHRRRGGRP
ncbi:MAG TPA: hypothetical protein VF880_09085, partial [Actinomycetes bacterium]